MGSTPKDRRELERELRELRERAAEVEATLASLDGGVSVASVPPELHDVFAAAQQVVGEHFAAALREPERARITFSNERYILIRAASLSTEFFDLVTSLYRDREPAEARAVALGMLFDLAHALGKADAAAFHEQLGLEDPVEKLSAGPVHFAFTGWARVELLPGSAPSPDDDFLLIYDHPYSFEAEAWLQRGDTTDFPVCAMNAGYSSGWCEQSFEVSLVAVEVSCVARGDADCRFVMAPPHRIAEHLERLQASGDVPPTAAEFKLEVPEFFRRKRLEDELRQAHDSLELRVDERTTELQLRNEDLAEANARLSDLNRARDQFLAVISHELRTPLVTSVGYVELLLRGTLGPVDPGIEKGMRVALRNLRRLAELVDDILRYHQLSHTDPKQTVSKSVDLAGLCRECAKDLTVRTGKPAADIQVTIDDALPAVQADDNSLRQVLANLLNNAAGHGGEHVRITLSAAVSDSGQVRVTIEDNGPGMPAEMLARATQPFVRSGASQRGLGLGLAIVHRLLQAAGSTLELRSEPGEGTRASFELSPLPAEGGAFKRVDSELGLRAVLPSGSGGSRVLVVDDDRDTRDFVALTLDRHGYQVQTAASAEEALEVQLSFSPDLLLVDFCLPGMSGIELCRSVKANASVPVLLFSARAEESVRTEALAAGCDAYLTKPLPVPELLSKIKEHTGSDNS